MNSADQAFYGSAANYAMWGTTCRLCAERFGGLHRGGGQWDLGMALALAAGHKLFETPGGLDQEGREAIAFTRYGYMGILPGTRGSASKHECEPSSSTIHNYAFHWMWKPAKNLF